MQAFIRVNLSQNPLTPSPSPTRGEGSKKVWFPFSLDGRRG
ncbi:hypothetical protein MC7420_551 [Coleofasciculus chthonoplastes PCC 7420]|uniref:Uncharacterized protein n=1 Tax=Coleofasciculus chthonoplastes PCC 7420 TaxID=118168 RepID=B4VL83_9CYAN|nr:hypothetical protein MC7420_551 [Coleofasciculus chthonoplastes PCC 7420]